LQNCLQSAVGTAANLSLRFASILVGDFACDAPVTSAVAGDSAVIAAVGVF